MLLAIATYNGLVGLRQRVRQAFADVDVQLKQRHDLVPNLVETVKGYASHERETLENVIKVNIFLVDVNDRPALNEVYTEFFPNNPPGRTCFGGAQFGGNVLVEIECVAKINS